MIIKNKEDMNSFMSHLWAKTFKTPCGVYKVWLETGKYGYENYSHPAIEYYGEYQDSTSWYSKEDFFAVVWRDRKEINNQERRETAQAVSENK